jgi:hypothetical protein
MPATHTFANLCARLNRAPVYVRGLQRRFGLPIPAEAPTVASPRALRGENSSAEEPRTKNEDTEEI